jgi:hypothetical protein
MVSQCTFDHNQAVAGNDNLEVPLPPNSILGPSVGAGGGLEVFGQMATISGSMFNNNQTVGGQGSAGDDGDYATGGGITIVNFIPGVTAAISNCTLEHNTAIGGQGGAGGAGGNAEGGGISNLLGATLMVNQCTLSHNLAVGGDAGAAGNGGNGLGGGLFNETGSMLTVTASTITDNQANGDQGDDGGKDGQGVGGGVYNLGAFASDNATIIAYNHASTSNDDIFT